MKNKQEFYKKLAKDIISLVGEEKNISKVIHCVTRLRFYLKDDSQVNKTEIKRLDGVMGIVEASGQFQVVVGAAVDEIYKEVMLQLSLSNDETEEHIELEIKEDRSGFDKIKHLFNQLLGVITGSIMPVISILAASGIIKSILIILTVSTNIVPTTSGLFIIINAMADSVFYFLPIMIAFNAAKRLDGNPMLTAVIAGVIVHPSVIEAANEGLNVLNIGSINFPFVSYTYSIFPMILAAWLVKKLEVWLKKWIPLVIQSLMIPVIVIGIVSAITFLVTGPVIMWLSKGMASGLENLLNLNAPIFGAIIDGFYQILVVFGLHWGFIPIYINDFATQGFSQLSAIVSILAVAQGAAALAVAIKSKKRKIKEVAYTGAVSAFFGITEPAIYGINLRFRKPFIFASIASAVGGFLIGTFKVTMWSIMGPLIGLPSFIDPVNGITSNFWYIIMITAIVMTLSFVLTYIWGYDDEMEIRAEREKPRNPTK